MIKVEDNGEDVYVEVGGREIEVLDATDELVLAECDLADLADETADAFPDMLGIEIHSPDGFGTFFFHELHLLSHGEGVALQFRCHTPNKYWEGRFGLATFITAIHGQVVHSENWKAMDIEIEDDWKGITLQRITPKGNPLHASILAAADDLRELLHAAEIALGGLTWKEAYSTDEALFCRELLYPLLRRMGFLFVRYSHGKKEYGKDFTFSEITPFGTHRHYGLQAKAGDISGGTNAPIDALLGQLADAFAMPYYEVGSREPRYISTFIIAISGSFTENAREKIVGKMPQGTVGSVYFLDRERITELVERYWNVSAPPA
jgi:hypothetical protein